MTAEGVEAVLVYLTENCDLEDFPELPDHAAYVGFDGAREWTGTFERCRGGIRPGAGDFIDAGADRVVAVIAMRGSGKGSGAPLDAQAVWVHELRGTKISRMRAFTTKEQALRVAGLAE